MLDYKKNSSQKLVVKAVDLFEEYLEDYGIFIKKRESWV